MWTTCINAVKSFYISCLWLNCTSFDNSESEMVVFMEVGLEYDGRNGEKSYCNLPFGRIAEGGGLMTWWLSCDISTRWQDECS